MKKILIELEKINTKNLYFILVTASVLLAARIQYIQQGWINADTVLYFESARLISLGQYKEAMNVYNWLTYPFFISEISNLTKLNIHHSAQLLNVIFFAITSISFIKIIELGGGNKKTMITGSLILFSSTYIVGDVLEMLMRDQGFWAFFLTSIVFFIRFKSNHKYLDAFLWQIFGMLAMLFRIEAIMYILFLPILLLFESNLSLSTRVKNYINCNSVSILGAIAIIVTLMINSQLTMKSFGRLQEVFTSNSLLEMTNNLMYRAQIMNDQVLGEPLSGYALLGLVFIFICKIIIESISVTGPINFILATCSSKQKELIKKPTYTILKVVAIITLVTLFLIISKVFLLSGRYVVGLGFILMIFAAFQLGKILTEYTKGKSMQMKSAVIVGVIFIIMLGGIIKNIWPKSKGYNFRQEAIGWLKQNNHNNASVFYNEPRLRYYAGEKFIGSWADNYKYLKDETQNESFKKYEWILIKSSKKHPDHKLIEESFPEYHLVMKFSSVKKDKEILIYKKK